MNQNTPAPMQNNPPTTATTAEKIPSATPGSTRPGTARTTKSAQRKAASTFFTIKMKALLGIGALALLSTTCLGAWVMTRTPHSVVTTNAPVADTPPSAVSAVPSTADSHSPPARTSTAPAIAAVQEAGVPVVQSSPDGSVLAPAAAVVTTRFFCAGSASNTEFLGALALSNGDLLVCGSSDDLGWTGSAPRTTWATTGIPGGNGDRIGFVLHLSGDLSAIKHVYQLPKGAAKEILRLHSTEIPGNPTGSIFVSGGCTGLQPKDDAYFIMRLSGDALTGTLTAQWATPIAAPGSTAGGMKGEGNYKQEQPWDVTNDGRVIAASGCAFDFDWAELRIIGADGKPTTLPGWTTTDGRSYIALKAGSDAGLRSQTQADFDYRQNDENGNPGRKGRYPDDYYFKGPKQGGPGYTGYKVSNKPTQRVGQFAVDRRDNHLYFGYSTQTRLPGGEPDFEPAIVAMDEQGKLLWWARGYREVERKPEDGKGNQDGQNSPPDQFIDFVAIDYAHDRLSVLARCHGNGVINFWAGNTIAKNPGAHAFQNAFTGSKGNLHISWIGTYGLRDGTITASTYIAELAEGARVDKPLADGPLVGWPSPNGGWPDVNTTRVHGYTLDYRGRPCVAAIGRRPYTTAGALIENVKPGAGHSAWAPFARVYESNLSGLAYSTILRGPWDTTSGTSGDDDIDLHDIVALADGILVIGSHALGKSGTITRLPTVGVPAWGSAAPPGNVKSGVIAILKVPPTN